jgi:hypothetical protein
VVTKKGSKRTVTVGGKRTPKDAIDDSTKVQVVIRVDGEDVAIQNMDRRGPGHPFNSGSVGFYAGGKVSVEGFNHQLSMTLTQVGTKGQDEDE